MKTTRILSPVLAVALLVTNAFAQDEDSLERDYSEELPRIAPLEPNEALDSFEVHDEFRLDLAAAEPLVHDPIAMAFDAQGRLFVVEMRGYSEQRDENIGAIRLLTDMDGDGTYDKSTEFLGGLAWPTAVACWDGGVFIGVSPDILYAKDTNGDGVADEREVVYSGFGLSNVQGLLNTFKWGLDNRIYGATSSSGAEVRPGDDPAALPITLRGRDFSFDPATRELRPESGGGQHGLSFDDWGRKFVCHNSNHCQLIHFEDRYIARNPYYAAPNPRTSIAADGPAADVYRISPVEPWRVVRTRLRVKGLVPGPVEGGGTAAGYFTSATGITVYKGDAWPKQYWGNVFIGDVGSNLIHRKTVEPDGISMIARRADQDTEFIRSTDIWFRPVQHANGPDGNLYAADMYREVIEHPDSLPPIIKQHLDLTSGHDRGRIYRIAAKDYEYKAPPNLAEYATADLVPLLAHDNAWHRETASRLIYERQDKSIINDLRDLAKDSEFPVGRMHAMYALKGLNALDARTVLTGLGDAEPHIREHAVRLAESKVDNDQIIEKLVEMADDSDLRVRYQLAFTLGYVQDNGRNQALATLAANDGDDKWMQTAILSSAFAGADEIFTALLEAPNANNKLITQLAGQVGASTTQEKLGPVFATLEQLDNASQRQAMVGRIIEGMKQAGKGGDVYGVLSQYPTAANALDNMLQAAYERARNENTKGQELIDTLQTVALGPYAEAQEILPGFLDQRYGAEVQQTALRGLRQYDSPDVPEILLAKWDTFSPTLRDSALEALFSRRVWLNNLLDAIAAGEFNPRQLDSVRVATLMNHPQSAISDRAQKLLQQDDTKRDQVVEEYKDALELDGNPERGEQIFIENCAQCHQVGNTGHVVGPDLTTVAQAGPDKILMNVLNPNSEVNPQYINYTIETTDWETFSGIITSETATSITVTRANGASDTILRVNIESMQSSDLSIMPEGLEEAIDKQAMADLIAYLTTLN